MDVLNISFVPMGLNNYEGSLLYLYTVRVNFTSPVPTQCLY